jgi:hypothetical protein
MAGRHHFVFENIIRTGHHHGDTGFVPFIIHCAVSHSHTGNISDAVSLSMLHSANIQNHIAASCCFSTLYNDSMGQSRQIILVSEALFCYTEENNVEETI